MLTTLRPLLLGSLALALAPLTHAGAPVVVTPFYNVDFGSVSAAPASSFGGAANQLGFWNNIASSTTTNLANIGGAFLGAQITVTAAEFAGNSPDYTGDLGQLMNDNFYTGLFGPWSFTITGLPNGAYDLYYYAPTHTSVRTGSFTVNGVAAPDLTGSSSGSGTVQGVDWQVIYGIPVTTGTLTTTFGTATQSFNGLSGMQLVPEPSTTLLLAGALTGLALRRRRAAGR